MSDQLEQRMRSLSGTATLRAADEDAISRLWLKSTPRRRSERRTFQISVAVATVVVAILLANIVAAYFAPRYQRALADSGVGPISQRFLAAVGLNAGDITGPGDSATSSGHTLKLEGAYADGLRTVLFVSIDGKGVAGNPKGYGLNPGDWGVNYDDMTLTDQFGYTYGGVGTGGPTDFQFEALKFPASQLGGRMTLHITGIWAMWKALAVGPNHVIDTDAFTTHGDWTLHATLVSAPAHSIALPAPIHTSQADYAFTSITATATEMVLHWTVDSPLNEPLRKPPVPDAHTDPAANPVMQEYFTPRVYDAGGAELRMEEWGFTWPKTGPAEGVMTVFIPGPGRYRIQLGGAVESRWVVVP